MAPPRKPIVGYAAAHYRLGDASRQLCSGDHPESVSASDWSYMGGCPNELTERYKRWVLRYSLNPSFYRPLCRSCHLLEDKKGGELAYQAKLTNAQAQQIRARYAAGDGSQYELAREYGISQTSINKIVRNLTYRGEVEE